jgi:hypothetical protein
MACEGGKWDQGIRVEFRLLGGRRELDFVFCDFGDLGCGRIRGGRLTGRFRRQGGGNHFPGGLL